MIFALCPTYRRTRLLNNSIDLFFKQTYPGPATMLVFNDGEHAYPACLHYGNKTVIVLAFSERFPTLGAKYNALIDYAVKMRARYLFIWEDDDVYLPNHIEKYMECFNKGAKWVKPNLIYTRFGGKLQRVDPQFSYFASIAFTSDVANPENPIRFREDHIVQFDIDFMCKLQLAFGDPCNPITDNEPTYVFRWDTTGAYHGQGFMYIGNEWYKLVPLATQSAGYEEISPNLDEDTKNTLDEINNRINSPNQEEQI